jgi:hypothetical protein
VVDYDRDSGVAYKDRVYRPTKVGFYILNDPMTRINMDFNQHVCYHGLSDLKKSIADGKPHGLAALGTQWGTFYEALPHLPEDARESWYLFDHFYSDSSYPMIVPLVLSDHPKTLVDIGTNTGRFAILLAESDPQLDITIIDLPDQLEVAKKNLQAAGFGDHVTATKLDLLKPESKFPKNLDIYWMSQFLSCFGKDEVISILKRVRQAMNTESRAFIMETCWDRQQHEASAFSLVNTSPYFTCIASGNSKMYHSEELTSCVTEAGLELVKVTDNIGICHSLFECRRCQ